MIRPLRRAHRVAAVILAIVLPLLLLAALRARRIPAPMTELPEAVRPGGGR